MASASSVVADVRTCHALVVGSGVAGLSVALGLQDRGVTVLTRGHTGRDGASCLARGGIAAAVGGGDTPQLHARDTLAVAGELGDPAVVAALADGAAEQIRRLAALGALFDRNGDGLALGREAAHSRPRIVHAGGDATGAEVMRTLRQAVVDSPGVRLVEDTRAVDLVVDQGRVVGVLAVEAGETVLYLARATVLASGGSGRLWLYTTNPAEATADGLAMAARAGALLADLEFVQFHPTALAAGIDPLPLLTEALRGAGALLLDEHGRRFMQEVDPRAELAPRDVVARAVFRRLSAGCGVYLDAREVDAVGERFPGAVEAARLCGLDPRRHPLPVSPAAHYHMGGVCVDGEGRSSLAGLWAVGEVAASGVHGANRLASNSLLEGLVFGARVARSVADFAAAGPVGLPVPEAARPRAPASEEPAEDLIVALRRLLWERVGLVRSAAGLGEALARLEAWSRRGAADLTTRNMLTVASLVTRAALARPESRGSHWREDHPEPSAALRHRLALRCPRVRERSSETPVIEPLPVAPPGRVDARSGAGR